MDNNVLAKIENIEITKEQFINVMRGLPQQQAMEFSTQEGSRKLLDEMIAGELFYLEAEKNNLEQDEEFIKIMEEAKHNMLQRYAVQKLLEDIKVSQEEIKEYYNNNKNEFVAEEQVSARHILVDSEEGCLKIKEEIVNGLDFSEAASKYSTCPSKERGGALGSFIKGKMVPEFSDAAFELAIGEVSDPVKTQFGYHLIIVDEKKEAHEKSLDEVAGQISQKIAKDKQYKVYDAKVKELKSQYKIEVNESLLR